MFTSIDKALTAIVMGVLYLISYFGGFDFGLTEPMVAAIFAALTPFLVWLIPNKAKPAT